MDIDIYRRQKERDFVKKEEERKKLVDQAKKQKENNKEMNIMTEELSKKPYTFDSDGTIIYTKSLNVDNLPKDVNFQLKYGLKKGTIVTKNTLNLASKALEGRKTKKKTEYSLDGAIDQFNGKDGVKNKTKEDLM